MDRVVLIEARILQAFVGRRVRFKKALLLYPHSRLTARKEDNLPSRTQTLLHEARSSLGIVDLESVSSVFVPLLKLLNRHLSLSCQNICQVLDTHAQPLRVRETRLSKVVKKWAKTSFGKFYERLTDNTC